MAEANLFALISATVSALLVLALAPKQQEPGLLWGGTVYTSKQQFQEYLKAKGLNYKTWLARNPGAAPWERAAAEPSREDRPRGWARTLLSRAEATAKEAPPAAVAFITTYGCALFLLLLATWRPSMPPALRQLVVPQKRSPRQAISEDRNVVVRGLAVVRVPLRSLAELGATSRSHPLLGRISTSPDLRPGRRPATTRSRTARSGQAASLTGTRRPFPTFSGVESRVPATVQVALALCSIVGVGGFFRIWNIGALGFNSDEAVYSGQGAAIVGIPELAPYFPAFRAHPLLFQTLLSIGWWLDQSEMFGRILSAAFGIATIVVVYRLGALLYGRRAGFVAALFISVMPYHVVVSRQVLLDAPMTFFATLTLLALARYVTTMRSVWLYGAAAAMGLTFLSKETAVLLLGAVYAFFAVSADVRLRLRHALGAGALLVGMMAVFPLTLRLAGSERTGQNYLAWQLFRRPNHTLTFYPVEVTLAIGPLVLLAAAAGIWFLRNRFSWRERLLLAWIAIPALFFELWPVKGYQYLLPIAPAVAILAARFLVSGVGPLAVRPLRLAAILVVAVSIAVPSWQRVSPSSSTTFLAGSGGVPGGREAGAWIDVHVPRNSILLTIGPSMANIVQFYGKRKAYGLSVSPNPLSRNPSYDPVTNPDLLLRRNEIQYLVWDSFSANRSRTFSEKLLRYADRYHGRVVHTQAVDVTRDDGTKVSTPVIVIYEVRS